MAQKKGAVNFKQEKRKKRKVNKRKPKENKTHAEICKQKHLAKSKLNRFYVTIKLRLDVVIFQQRIIWEELFQSNDMRDNLNRGTFGYPCLYRTIRYPVAENKLTCP